MILNDDANKIIKLLYNNGYQAYAVGGCVRDAIMGRTAGDIDITSSATPNELENVLSQNGIRYIETGLKHGTVTAIINQTPYEITTFRSDGNYADNRHPENVKFVVNIKEDMARRDFTINAIGYNVIDGYVDYYNGIQDINDKVIRAVGNPDLRFKEDALRIMRAIRFSSILGFEIEEETKIAIFKNKELLKNIAVERIYTELIKLLLGDNVKNVLIEYRDIIAVIIPELIACFDFHQNTKWHSFDVYTHIVNSVEIAPKIDYMRLGMLLHDIGKPQMCVVDENGGDHFKGHQDESVEMAKIILKRLKVSNDVFNKIIVLIQFHDDHITTNKANIKRWLRRFGDTLVFDFIDFKIADLSSHSIKYAEKEINNLINIRKITRDIIDNNEPYAISHLSINGNDLINIGYSGRMISDELENLIRIVSSNKDLNTKEYLLLQAKKDLGF